MSRNLYISVNVTYITKDYYHCFIFTRSDCIQTAREISYTEAMRKLRKLEKIAGRAAELDINYLDQHIWTKTMRIWA